MPRPSLLSLVLAQFQLDLVETTVPLITPVPGVLPPFRQESIEWGLQSVHPQVNERSRCGMIVGQLMLSIAVAERASLFLGCPFEVDWMRGWVGDCDYLISHFPLTYRIHPPVAVIVEVKRELSRCLSHCLVELAAAQQFNQSPEPIYGVLTTGLEWQFLKLENRVVTIEQTIYPITPLESIAALLTAIIRLPTPHRMNA